MCVFTSKWVSYFLYIKNGRETNHVSSNKSKREEGTHEKKRGGKKLKNNDGIFFCILFLTLKARIYTFRWRRRRVLGFCLLN